MSNGGSLGPLIKLAIVVALAYFAYTKVLPLVREGGAGLGGGSAESGTGEGAVCVSRAADASRSFGRDIGRFTRAGEVEAWDDHVWNTETQIEAAEEVCGCDLASCEKATQALGELRHLMDDLDSIVRSDSIASFNPARRQERVDSLLDSARSLSRQGR